MAALKEGSSLSPQGKSSRPDVPFVAAGPTLLRRRRVEQRNSRVPKTDEATTIQRNLFFVLSEQQQPEAMSHPSMPSHKSLPWSAQSLPARTSIPCHFPHLQLRRPRRLMADACTSDLRPAAPLQAAASHVHSAPSGGSQLSPPWRSNRRRHRPVLTRAIVHQEHDQQQEPEPVVNEPQAHTQSPPSNAIPSAHAHPHHSLPSELPKPPQLRAHDFLEAWICVHQDQSGGPAEVYEHSTPMTEAVWDCLQQGQQQPPKLMTVHERNFRSCAYIQGNWANFRVRLTKGFHPFEEMTMFPNRVQLLDATRSDAKGSSGNSLITQALAQPQVVELVTPSPPCSEPGLQQQQHQQQHKEVQHSSIQPLASDSADGDAGRFSYGRLNGTRSSTSDGFSSMGSICSDATYSACSSSLDSNVSDPSSTDSSNSTNSISNAIRDSTNYIASGYQVHRRCHNARNLGDLVQLLAEPTEIGILAHLANAGRLLSYKPKHIWNCLKARWGEEALQTLGFTPRRVHRLLQQGKIYNLTWSDELLAFHHYRGSVRGEAHLELAGLDMSVLHELQAANQHASLQLALAHA